MGSKLSGVIDFDGGISSYGALSAALAGSAPVVVRMQQMPAAESTLGALAAQNIFPLAHPRWLISPWKDGIPLKDEKTALLKIHSIIPENMMFVAGRKAM